MTAAECWRGCTSGAPTSAHLQVELGEIAGVDRVVTGVVRSGRHLVGQQPTVFQHEVLDAQHADVAERLDDAPRRVDCFGLDPQWQRERGRVVTASMPSRCRFCCTGK